MPAAITNFVDVTVTLVGATSDKFNFGALLGVFDHSVSADRQDGPFSSMEEVNAAGFTSGAEPEVNAWATSVFAQDDGVSELLIGREDAGDADWTATMDAIEAEDPNSWYIHTIESRGTGDLTDVAAWTEARNKLFIAQSSNAAILTGGAGNPALLLQASGYHRTALFYHATNNGALGYLDGCIASSGGGLNLDGPAGAGTWAYRQLEVVPFDDVNSSQASEIYDANANLYGKNKGLSFSSFGTMASGRFIDVTTSLDWLKARIEEEVLATFVGAPTKIPFTNAGIAILAASLQVVYDKGLNFGHLSPDEPPTMVVPTVTDISAADKAARELNLTGNATLTGAIHKAIINITVQQ